MSLFLVWKSHVCVFEPTLPHRNVAGTSQRLSFILDSHLSSLHYTFATKPDEGAKLDQKNTVYCRKFSLGSTHSNHILWFLFFYETRKWCIHWIRRVGVKHRLFEPRMLYMICLWVSNWPDKSVLTSLPTFHCQTRWLQGTQHPIFSSHSF